MTVSFTFLLAQCLFAIPFHLYFFFWSRTTHLHLYSTRTSYSVALNTFIKSVVVYFECIFMKSLLCYIILQKEISSRLREQVRSDVLSSITTPPSKLEPKTESKKPHYEFMGPIGTLLITILAPLMLFYVNLACSKVRILHLLSISHSLLSSVLPFSHYTRMHTFSLTFWMRLLMYALL